MVASQTNKQEEFTCPKEEASYWKQEAADYLQRLQDVRDEFDDYQEGSRELEAELEAQLEQYEHRVKDLVSAKASLEEENEMLKEKLDSMNQDSHIQITSLQDDNMKTKAVKEEMTKYIRELEQTNDDLERAKRATICSLEEFDFRLNSAIERNAFLENELEEKEELMVTVQRLKDEARDLRADLGLKSDRHQSLSESKAKVERTTSMNETNKDIKDGVRNLTLTPRSKETIENEKNKYITMGTPSYKNTTTSNPMTPSARISALNIVSDLLRKVGALESKLASCRNFVQEHPRNGKTQHLLHGVTPIADSPKLKSKTPQSTNTTKKTTNTPISGLVKVNV